MNIRATPATLGSRGFVFYDPPTWKSRSLSIRATLAVLTHGRGGAGRTDADGRRHVNWLEPQSAEAQWLDSATGLLEQLQYVPDGVDVPGLLAKAIAGIAIGLSNVGGAVVGSMLGTAAAALSQQRGPDHTWLPGETFTQVVLPLRVIDATEWLDYQRAPPAVRPDILDAFEAIWIAREFEAAYAYVAAVVKSGEWKP